MAPSAVIYGCAGASLSPGEAWFFKTADPWGFILFKRNCVTRSQLRDLVSSLRESVGRPDAPVLIDQEGGRVARLGPPEWAPLPPAGDIGSLYAQDRSLAHEALRLHTRLTVHDLQEMGITVNCLPLADVPAEDGHGIIGDRAYGRTPEMVADMARVCAEELMAHGILPVLKHLPGHGRATVDSHESLPVVTADAETLESVDFAPFKALSGLPLAMTAHVVYTAFDAAAPATFSRTVIRDVIRGRLGFDGLLMTDDLSMGALSGGFAERTRRALDAGCDIILHCNGHMDEMVEIAAAVPRLEGEALSRADRALSRLKRERQSDVQASQPFDAVAERAKLSAILGDSGQTAL